MLCSFILTSSLIGSVIEKGFFFPVLIQACLKAILQVQLKALNNNWYKTLSICSCVNVWGNFKIHYVRSNTFMFWNHYFIIYLSETINLRALKIHKVPLIPTQPLCNTQVKRHYVIPEVSLAQYLSSQTTLRVNNQWWQLFEFQHHLTGPLWAHTLQLLLPSAHRADRPF